MTKSSAAISTEGSRRPRELDSANVAVSRPGLRGVERAARVADRRARVQPRLRDHGADVRQRVVVRPDRPREVLAHARCSQVAGRGVDRVARAVGIGLAVAARVDRVAPPGRRKELHPADGAGARDGQVRAEVGLELVDRREQHPRHAVARARVLVDRDQPRRDLVGRLLGPCRRLARRSRDADPQLAPGGEPGDLLAEVHAQPDDADARAVRVGRDRLLQRDDVALPAERDERVRARRGTARRRRSGPGRARRRARARARRCGWRGCARRAATRASAPPRSACRGARSATSPRASRADRAPGR